VSSADPYSFALQQVRGIGPRGGVEDSAAFFPELSNKRTIYAANSMFEFIEANTWISERI